MAGKRVRLVRSSCSIDDMSMLNSPPELQMEPPSHCLPIVPKAKTNVSRLGTLTLRSPKMKMDSCDQGLSCNFLNICSYCKKNMGHEDDIYMYRHFVAQSVVTDKLYVVENPVIKEMAAAAAAATVSASACSSDYNYIHVVAQYIIHLRNNNTHFVAY